MSFYNLCIQFFNTLWITTQRCRIQYSRGRQKYERARAGAIRALALHVVSQDLSPAPHMVL